MNQDHKAGMQKFYRGLRIDGGVGGIPPDNANGDYSSTPTKFMAYIGPTDYYIITMIKIELIGGSAFSNTTYGDTAALTNGVQLYTENALSERVFDLTGPKVIKDNDDIYFFCGEHKPPSDWQGVKHIYPEWRSTQWNAPLAMKGASGHRFVAELNDDFTALTEHHFYIAGINLGKQLVGVL
jgi:hypothetical protein